MIDCYHGKSSTRRLNDLIIQHIVNSLREYREDVNFF